MKNQIYKKCSRCILDTKDDSRITFDDNGICNHCYYYDVVSNKDILTGDEGLNKVDDTVKRIKNASKGKTYDCLLGLSGGVDSSYLAYLAKKLGLNPLCVHFDNGWNSELAVKNIEQIVNKLGFDLTTYVIDWEEFKDLQRSYIKAGVIDIEALTDHAIYASLMQIAFTQKIKFILSGTNVVTEAILPNHWVHNKADYINILDIQSKHGTLKLKSFPLNTRQVKRKFRANEYEFIEFLNWIPYNKAAVKKILIDELEWTDYGGKHYESIFTKFYQAYILPVKFGVDKRKAHLSTLICSGQITRAEALEEMKVPLYDERKLIIDKAYVLKKLGFAEEEFDAIMKSPPSAHSDYAVEGSLFNYYPILKPLKPLWEFIKKRRNK
jgi:N-acetyl sugar amidotransferase